MPLSKELQQKLPFISVVRYGKNEYVGVIANQDNSITTMYIYTEIPTGSQIDFLNLCRVWWDESNRMIPIDIFLRDEITRFKDYMIVMSTKDVEVLLGPCTRLSELCPKNTRSKRIKMMRR